MKKNSIIIILVHLFSFQTKGQQISDKNETIQPKEIMKDWMSFWSYWSDKVKLTDDFIGLDTSNIVLCKNDFLKAVSTGEYLPMLLKNGEINYYKLYKIDTSLNKNISTTIQNESVRIYGNFKMEGTKFPFFDYIDLNGKRNNKKTFTGKIVVIKCWFLRCQRCEVERPLVNVLIKKYNQNKDISFISLAYDKPQDLKKFSIKHPTLYSIIPVKKQYLEDSLNIIGYPTYIILDKKGIIIKVVETYAEMEIKLNKIVEEKLHNKDKFVSLPH